ncbi:MAG: histidine phosphatase family protein [Actinomycetota bacterium]|nr:histidine phosphatase family protein [Actinomycetota bacterium]
MLWLLRHADAASGSPDSERPLTERGVRQAQAAGRALERLGASIDVCLTSPKLRALETARLAAERIGVEVRVEPRLSGEPFDAHEIVDGLGSVLLVGHDPAFSLTLHDLTGAQARMHKGGLAGVEKGELLVLMRPSELEAIATGAEVAS